MIYSALKGIGAHLMPEGRTGCQELLTILIAMSLLTCGSIGAQPSSSAAVNKSAANFDKLPLSFEINKGQTDAPVKFLSRGKGYALFLTSDSAVFKLENSALPQASSQVLRMEFLNASQEVQVSGSDQLPGVANCFLGNNPEKWHSGIHTYQKVSYQGIYRGIDAVFYGNQRQLEYDFVVAPDADPNQIAL
jgi:hypothetical protein